MEMNYEDLYPAHFPIAVIGLNEHGFEEYVVTILQGFAPFLIEDSISSQPSRNGNYLSVRATVLAESREHLEQMYDQLKNEQRILMVL